MKTAQALMVWMVLGLLCSCQESAQKPVRQSTSSPQMKESLEKANRYLVSDEEEDIDNYVRRHRLELISTGTGLRYQVVENGQGALVEPGQTVTLEYVLFDLIGDTVYSSDKEGLMEFVVGRSAVPSGLDEVVRLLHKGDRAWAVIPSHLGYGLLGDQKRVPSRATLIYNLKIKEVE